MGKSKYPDTYGISQLPTSFRAVTKSGEVFASPTWEKAREKETGGDRYTNTKLVFSQRKTNPNKTTLHSLACWWVAHLHSYHSNSRPCGKGFWLNPGGQCLIEWLSGSKMNDDV